MPKGNHYQLLHQNPQGQWDKGSFYSRLFFSAPPTTWITLKHPPKFETFNSLSFMLCTGFPRSQDPTLHTSPGWTDEQWCRVTRATCSEAGELALEPWLHCLLRALCWDTHLTSPGLHFGKKSNAHQQRNGWIKGSNPPVKSHEIKELDFPWSV